MSNGGSMLRFAGFEEFTAFEREALAAPDDGVPGEACDPDSHGNDVAQRQKPETGQDLVVCKDLCAYCHGQCKAEEETEAEEPEADGADATGNDVE